MAEGSLAFYVGALGSGKTSFGFEEAFARLLKGGTVVTNIDFYPDKVAEKMAEYGLEFDPARLIRFEDGEDLWKHAVKGTTDLATMLLVDEAHVEHNARAWDKTAAEQVLFNTMARKLKVDVVYITQDINNVDKQFRRMAQKIVYCRNLAHFKLFGFLRFPFNLFVRVPYICGPGVQPHRENPEITIKPLSWGLFNSHALVGKAERTFSVLQAAETSPLKRIPKRVKPINLWWAAPLAAACTAFL